MCVAAIFPYTKPFQAVIISFFPRIPRLLQKISSLLPFDWRKTLFDVKYTCKEKTKQSDVRNYNNP